MALAQESAPANRIKMGVHITGHLKEYASGINLTSPYFFNEKAAIRLRSNWSWSESIDELNNEYSERTSDLQVGMVGLAGEVNDMVKFYSEGGVLVSLATESQMSDQTELRGYGLMGVEVCRGGMLSYFLDAGIVGLTSKEGLINSPVNGFQLSSGLCLTL
jgi:hypothetical protein